MGYLVWFREAMGSRVRDKPCCFNSGVFTSKTFRDCTLDRGFHQRGNLGGDRVPRLLSTTVWRTDGEQVGSRLSAGGVVRNGTWLPGSTGHGEDRPLRCAVWNLGDMAGQRGPPPNGWRLGGRPLMEFWGVAGPA